MNEVALPKKGRFLSHFLLTNASNMIWVTDILCSAKRIPNMSGLISIFVRQKQVATVHTEIRLLKIFQEPISIF